MDSLVFEKTKPTKLFFRCAIPAMISMAVGSLYSIADGIFVGRFIGEDALAAVNLIMPLFMISFALAGMIATGASVRISMLLGQKDRDGACRTFSFSIKVITIISFIIGIIGFVFAEPITLLLSKGATEESVRLGTTYLKVFAAFMPLLPVYFATDNFLRVGGKEKLSMILNVSTQLLNIVLDFILIVLFKQGIWAAAFTSCISISLGSAISLFIFSRKKLDLYFVKENIPFKQFLKLTINGSSEFFNNIAASIMFLFLNYYLLQYGGTTAVAAMSIVMYVDSIIGMMIFGMCDSLQPAISYCYGAKNFKKVKAIMKRVLLAALLISFVAFLFTRLAGHLVAPIFIKPDDTALLNISITAIHLFSFSYLIDWVNLCLSSFFTALERPVHSLISSFLGTLVFPIGCLIILSEFKGLNGIWFMPTVAGALSAAAAVIMAFTIKLEKKQIQKI